MAKIELQTTTREVLGKKVRFLRREGITPVHLYGHGVKSLALQCEAVELGKVLKQAGNTGLINLRVDKVKRPRNVIIREIQKDMATGDLLHVDFYQLSGSEPIQVNIPIVLTGEAPALDFKENQLSHQLNSLSIECLPEHIPTRIEANVSTLTKAGEAIRVSDLVLDEEVTILTDPEMTVVNIHVQRAEKVDEEVAQVAEIQGVTPPLEEEPTETT
ncbi:50S ribosomal protein L25 [Chloroflexota bacterium]